MIDPHRLALEGMLTGLRKGWSGFLWMMRILFPVSFFTALLQWSGLLLQIDFVLQPAMKWLGLPSSAALPILIGLLTNIYGGIASMVVLPLSIPHMTLIAIFLLIAHNMIQEGIIQGNSGIHPFKATLFRLGAAIMTTAVSATFLDSHPVSLHEATARAQALVPFLDMVVSWLKTSVQDRKSVV